MKKTMLGMGLAVAVMALMLGCVSTYATDYTLNITDYPEFISANINPGLGSLSVTQEGDTTPGEVFLYDFNHSFNQAFDLRYNIREPENPEIVSDTLEISTATFPDRIYVDFFSDNLQENGLTALIGATDKGEIDTVTIGLTGGDKLIVQWESIPEPGTSVIVLAGLGLLGAFVRCRKH